jgi:hypothetical protein
MSSEGEAMIERIECECGEMHDFYVEDDAVHRPKLVRYYSSPEIEARLARAEEDTRQEHEKLMLCSRLLAEEKNALARAEEALREIDSAANQYLDNDGSRGEWHALGVGSAQDALEVAILKARSYFDAVESDASS